MFSNQKGKNSNKKFLKNNVTPIVENNTTISLENQNNTNYINIDYPENNTNYINTGYPENNTNYINIDYPENNTHYVNTGYLENNTNYINDNNNNIIKTKNLDSKIELDSGKNTDKSSMEQNNKNNKNQIKQLTPKKRGRRPKVSLSSDQLSTAFDKPETEAAKIFGISQTSFKKQLKTLGIDKWPFRRVASVNVKLKTIEKSIENIEESLLVNKQSEQKKLKMTEDHEYLTNYLKSIYEKPIGWKDRPYKFEAKVTKNKRKDHPESENNSQQKKAKILINTFVSESKFNLLGALQKNLDLFITNVNQVEIPDPEIPPFRNEMLDCSTKISNENPVIRGVKSAFSLFKPFKETSTVNEKKDLPEKNNNLK